MRLTNTIRDSFVAAALMDLPTEDYVTMQSKLLVDDAVKQMPDKVREIYKKYPEYFELKRILTPYGNYYGPWGNNTPSKEAMEKLEELVTASKIQSETQRRLRNKLRGVAYSVTTRKALIELLPEFAKYLPSENAPNSRLVPVITDIVSDFVKAGWPKQNQGKIETAKKELAAAA